MGKTNDLVVGIVEFIFLLAIFVLLSTAFVISMAISWLFSDYIVFTFIDIFVVDVIGDGVLWLVPYSEIQFVVNNIGFPWNIFIWLIRFTLFTIIFLRILDFLKDKTVS